MRFMHILKNVNTTSKLVTVLKRERYQIGLIPTMGSLHEGHLRLIRHAKRENDIVVVSIFVNPLQFGPKEDFYQYPRDFLNDQKLLRKERVDYLFAPSRRAMFPSSFNQNVSPGPLARYLCGPKRPGHFKGVVIVVKRLLDIIKPDAAYFGEKDYQQARIVENMVRKLGLKVKIRTIGTVREKDGLAMSSRNRYLTGEERKRASRLHQSLLMAKRLILKGEKSPKAIKKSIREYLSDNMDKIDYISISNPLNLRPLKQLGQVNLVAIACHIRCTRLIDNLVVKL
jgi:pantoate--beta-alanine ligase